MRLRMTFPVLLAAMIASGCAQTPRERAALAEQTAADEVKLARLLKGYTAGTPETCISQTIRRYNTIGVGNTILYRADSRLIYRNDTTGCQGVARGDILVTQNFGQQLCSGQIATTVDGFARIQTGGCSLGQFIPYRKDAK